MARPMPREAPVRMVRWGEVMPHGTELARQAATTMAKLACRPSLPARNGTVTAARCAADRLPPEEVALVVRIARDVQLGGEQLAPVRASP